MYLKLDKKLILEVDEIVFESKKSEVQSRALNAWYKAGCRGTLEAATAFGKTFSGIKAISYFVEKVNKDFKVLIVVPTVAIKDEWTKEIIKYIEGNVLNIPFPKELYSSNTWNTNMNIILRSYSFH